MSTETPEDDELAALAGEAALGLLDAATVAELRRRDGRFDEAVRVWQARLMPLAVELAPVAPPAGIWMAIEAATAPPAAARRPGLWDNLTFWRGLGLGATALAAAAAVLLAVLPRGAVPAQNLVATMNLKTGGAFVATARATASEVVMVVTPARVTVPAGKSDELWLILPNQKPRALGLLTGGGAVAMNLPASEISGPLGAVTLAVSVEPPGGSPTGLATGPVIGAAMFTPAAVENSTL
jgi:anti-sigma-K factor RskA